MLGGGAIGLAAATVLALIAADQFLVLLVFGGALIGGAFGYFCPSVGFSIGEAAAHLCIGIISGISERFHGASENSPRWLKIVFWCGIALGALGLVFRRW